MGAHFTPYRTAPDTLDAIRADLDALVAFQPVEPDTAAEARARHLRRQLAAAIDHGTELLAALGLPRLVGPGFWLPDFPALNDALDLAIATLDAFDADPDIEAGDDDEFTGDDELSLGWTAKVDQVHLGQDQDDHETTALERYGKGFFRSGPDDAEDDDGRGDEDSGIGDVDGYHEQCGFAVAGALPWSAGGYVA